MRAVLPGPARAARLRRPLRPGARRLGVQPAGARGARVSPHRRAAGRARLLAPGRRAGHDAWRAQFDDDWTNILFVGRVIPNKKIEDVIRFFHAYKTRFNPRSRLLLVGSYSGFERYLAMLQALVARLGAPDVHFVGHVPERGADGVLRRRRPVPLRERARRLLRAARSRRSTSGCRSLAYAATAVPATMDGAGVLYDTTDPLHVAALMDAVLDDPRIEDARARRAGRGARPAAGEGLRRHAARGSSSRSLAAPPRPAPRRSPSTSGTSSSSSSGSRSFGSTGRRLQALPDEPGRPGASADPQDRSATHERRRRTRSVRTSSRR